VRPDQPYNVRALAALRDNEPYRNPRLVQDHIEDSSVAGSVFGERRGGAREVKAPSQTKAKYAQEHQEVQQANQDPLQCRNDQD